MYPTKHKFQWLVQVQHNNFDSPSILGNTTQLPVMNILHCFPPEFQDALIQKDNDNLQLQVKFNNWFSNPLRSSQNCRWTTYN